jgi:hypothetical protein
MSCGGDRGRLCPERSIGDTRFANCAAPSAENEKSL